MARICVRGECPLGPMRGPTCVLEPGEWGAMDPELQNIVGGCIERRYAEGAGPDALTGIATPGMLSKQLEHRFTHPIPDNEIIVDEDGVERAPLLAIFIDGDKFGAINKLMNHTEGDENIKSLSRMLGSLVASKFRKQDTIAMPYGNEMSARRGGDEFLVLVPGLIREVAARRLLEIQRPLQEEGIEAFDHRGRPIRLTATAMGAYGTDIRTYNQVWALINSVDEALGDYKRGPRLEIPCMLFDPHIDPDLAG